MTVERTRAGPSADAHRAFENRLARSARHWGRWARRRGYGAYRVYDRDVPEFPFAIDCYVGDDASIGLRVHLQEIDTGWRISGSQATSRASKPSGTFMRLTASSGVRPPAKARPTTANAASDTISWRVRPVTITDLGG